MDYVFAFIIGYIVEAKQDMRDNAFKKCKVYYLKDQNNLTHIQKMILYIKTDKKYIIYDNCCYLSFTNNYYCPSFNSISAGYYDVKHSKKLREYYLPNNKKDILHHKLKEYFYNRYILLYQIIYDYNVRSYIFHFVLL